MILSLGHFYVTNVGTLGGRSPFYPAFIPALLLPEPVFVLVAQVLCPTRREATSSDQSLNVLLTGENFRMTAVVPRT